MAKIMLYSQASAMTLAKSKDGVAVRINQSRMAKAIASSSVAVPNGLSREEKRQLISSYAK